MNIRDSFEGISNALNYLEDIGIVNDYDVLLALEAYKFVSRNEILKRVEDTTEDKRVAVHDFTEIENKYNVLLEKTESDTVKVYVPVNRAVDITALELDLNLAEIQVVYITPLNFEELKDAQYVYPFNADILFKRILMEAIRLKATDLHFDVKHVDMQPKYTVSYRKGAELLPMQLFELTKELNAEIISRLIEANTSVSSLDLLDPAGVIGNATNILGNNDIELRISANKTLDGYHYVIRIQKKETLGFSLNQLGFHDKVQKDLETVMQKRNGITLVTGAIRTGKNTTVFAMLNELVKEPIKILSYESPVEVVMPFTQVDYFGSPDILLNAVRLAKKQDVNIAYLNEIPDKEVAFAIRDLANSSVHVITTMHMNRIWHLPYKLKEYYGDDYKDIISQINGVFNQKMFGVGCPECAEQMMTSAVEEKYAGHLQRIGVDTVRVSRGCASCSYTGVIPGKNQPYAEHLVFDEELIDKLLACDHPFQMENVLRDEVRKRAQSFEDYMRGGFETGSIPLYAVNQL